jgi:hypothetical protein
MGANLRIEERWMDCAGYIIEIRAGNKDNLKHERSWNSIEDSLGFLSLFRHATSQLGFDQKV